jgi:NAD(P)-dependent dehydrogenase (short-subunit alcohol dehydrogenase family)
MNANKWTTHQVPDLSGKVVIVTGGNSGLGYESVKAFAEKGATVVLASRSYDKGNAAREDLLKGKPSGEIAVMELDLGDLSSVKKFADSFQKEYDRLDVLLNNAGIMMTPYGLTQDGLESQMGVNHFGHFALTGLLLDRILATPASRIVNVSSMAHNRGQMDFDNLLFEHGRDYSPIRAYGRSKLANLLFTYELQRRLEAKGHDSLAVAAHPGVAQTNLGRYIEGKFLVKLLMPIFSHFTQDAAMGALPQIRASVDPSVKGGAYFGPDGRREMTGYPVEVQSNGSSHDREAAQRLWEVSEQLTGVAFGL